MESSERIVRAIAFHLPQFHPISENDEWWGKGFTEWTNVAKATPRFPGHYQPRLPASIWDFMICRVPESRAAQAELAASYGISTVFCYYHYWFNGRRILERPVNEIWQSGEPDFPFCLCWANENWTRRWDGLNDEVLLKQDYSPEDDLEHIQSLIPIFFDPRYICIMDRPVLLVYRASELPEPEKSADRWRREAERAGLKGLFLVRVESNGESGDPRNIGFDYSVEFQPYWPHAWPRLFRRRWWHIRRLGTHEPGLRDNNVLDYPSWVRNALAAPAPDYPRIPCVCPGWDNSPRRRHDANIVINSDAGAFTSRWLGEVVKIA